MENKIKNEMNPVHATRTRKLESNRHGDGNRTRTSRVCLAYPGSDPVPFGSVGFVSVRFRFMVIIEEKFSRIFRGPSGSGCLVQIRTM